MMTGIVSMTVTSRSNIHSLVKEKIRARVLDALAAGWTPEELWEERFWNFTEKGNRPGLMACMRPEQDIGEITPEYIELYRDDPVYARVVSRFYKKENDNGSF